MKPFIVILFFSFPAFPYFYELNCDANFQPKVGEGTIRSLMKLEKIENSTNIKFVAALEGYHYEVLWDKLLDCFYMSVKKNGHNLFFSTARVPTFEHNDTMTDVILADGTRRWISCGYKPKN